MRNLFWVFASLAMFCMADSAMAAGDGLSNIGKGVGAGITILGGGLGLGLIGAKMTESMARQPEMANDLRIAAIIMAALLEGVALFALLICFLIS